MQGTICFQKAEERTLQNEISNPCFMSLSESGLREGGNGSVAIPKLNFLMFFSGMYVLKVYCSTFLLRTTPQQSVFLTPIP